MNREPGWAESYIDKLVDWIRVQVQSAGATGTVMGLSGGIDSAVVTSLCARAVKDRVLALFMPCHSSPVDENCALAVAEQTGVELITVVLDDIYDQYIQLLEAESWGKMAKANVKVRLRAVTMYAYANELNRLVVGTSNASELAVGYFTKYGDGASDMVPLARLVKREVFELARVLGLPQEVIERPPSAGLWPGQTDEKEMGISYCDLDRYIRGELVAPDIIRRIEKLHAGSEHKRVLPAAPDF